MTSLLTVPPPRLQKSASSQAFAAGPPPTFAAQKSLVPRMMMQLAAEGDLKSTTIAKEGCLVLLDIAKFSKVTALMKKAGPGSSELVTTEVNKFFAKMIDAVADADGDVISFSGDAMLVIWEATPEIPLLKAVLQATRCALALASMSHKIDVLREHVKASGVRLDPAEQELCDSLEAFTVHTGMSLGRVNLLVAGGRGSKGSPKWMYTLEGQPINEVGITLNLSQSGEIAVTEDVVDYLEENGYDVSYEDRSHDDTDMECHIIRPGDITPEITVPTLPRRAVPEGEVVLKDRLPQLYYDTVERSLVTNAEGELRTTTIVFVKLITLSQITNGMNAEQFKAFQKVIVSTQKLTNAYNGVFNKVIIDDKGVVLLLLFGVPLHTHDDDPERAVEFSLKLLNKVRDMGQRASVGITRSKVFCGMTGSPLRQEYSTLGAGVNMAARLMCEAELLWEGKDSYVIVDEDIMLACVQSRRLCTSFVHIEDYNLVLKYKYTCKVYQVQAEGEESSSDSDSSSMSISGAGAALEGLGDTRRSSKRSHPVHSIGSSGRSQSSQSLSMSSPSMRSSDSSRSLNRVVSVRSMSSSINSGSHRRVIASKGNSFMSPTNAGMAGSGLASPPRSKSPLSKSPMGRGFAGRLTRTISMKSIEQKGGVKILGRKAELQAAHSFVQAVAEGRWHEKENALCFSGDRQTGKTTFLERVAEFAGELELAVYVLHGHETFQEMAFSAIAPLVEQILAVHPPHVLRELITDDDAEYLPLLHHVTRIPSLDLPSPAMAGLPLRDKVQKVNKLLLLMLKLLSGDGRLPILILVDDAQWIDGMSLGFFRFILEDDVKMIISVREAFNRFTYVGTHMSSIRSWRSFTSSNSSDSSEGVSRGLNDTDASAEVADEERSAFFQYIGENGRHFNLRALPERLAAELVRTVFGAKSVNPKLEALLWRKSSGYPGFLTKMAQALVVAGHVKLDGDTMVLRKPWMDLSSFLVRAVPLIETHVLQQLDDLTTPQKTVLSLAAVLSVFSLSMLEDCVEIYASEETCLGLNAHMTTLKQKQLIRRNKGNDFEFSLELARDVVYYSILRKERVLMHAAVVRATLANPTVTDDRFAQHMAEAEMDGKELEGDIEEAVMARVAKGELQAAYTAYHRPRRIVKEDDTLSQRALEMAAVAMETGQFATARRMVMNIRHRKRGSSVWKDTITRTRRLCCCLVRPTQDVPEGMLDAARLYMLQMETAFYIEDMRSVKKAMKAAGTLQKEAPGLNLTRYLNGVKHVVSLGQQWQTAFRSASPRNMTRSDVRHMRRHTAVDGSSDDEDGATTDPGSRRSRSRSRTRSRAMSSKVQPTSPTSRAASFTLKEMHTKYAPTFDVPEHTSPFEVLKLCTTAHAIDHLEELLGVLRDDALSHGSSLTHALAPHPPTAAWETSPNRARVSALELTRLYLSALASGCGVTTDYVQGPLFLGGWGLFDACNRLASAAGYSGDPSSRDSGMMSERLRQLSRTRATHQAVLSSPESDVAPEIPGSTDVLATIEAIVGALLNLGSGVVDDPAALVSRVKRHMCAGVATPVHGLLLWGICEVLTTVHQRVRTDRAMSGSFSLSLSASAKRAQSVLSEDRVESIQGQLSGSGSGQNLTLSPGNGAKSRLSVPKIMSQPEEVLAYLGECLSLLECVAELYPCLGMLHAFLAGYLAPTVEAQVALYTSVIDQAIAMDLQDSIIVWRARVRLLLYSADRDLDANVKATIARGSRYSEDMRFSDLVKAMQGDALRLRLFKSPEAVLLGECL